MQRTQTSRLDAGQRQRQAESLRHGVLVIAAPKCGGSSIGSATAPPTSEPRAPSTWIHADSSRSARAPAHPHAPRPDGGLVTVFASRVRGTPSLRVMRAAPKAQGWDGPTS